MKEKHESYDVVVMGGGLSGFCAAVAAARHGAKTVLIHNRPVLGGNASSEVRVTVHGAACHHAYARETGIVGEAMRAERASNHIIPNENGWTNSVFDMALYDIAMQESLLTLHLNTDVVDVELEDGRSGLSGLSTWPVATIERGYLHRPACHEGLALRAVHARIQNAETMLRLEGKVFLDCTGDALAAHLAGCEWRMGSESREETSEIHAAATASTDVMGNSIHIRCIDTGREAPFHAPDWAMHYDNADFFYKQGRPPNDPQGGYWWIEIGVPWNTIYDNETIRHELTRHALGVWDWMKNRDPAMKERCRNFALEFIGQVPGKRESRRVMGLHLLNENELQERAAFEDEIAYGGWFIDLHTPGGLLAEHSEPASVAGYDPSVKDVALKYIGPYSIPLRSLISKDVPNLMMAGRNISVTHAALGTVRVMATCGLMGQGAGTAAALAVREGLTPRAAAETRSDAIKLRLLRDGCFLPKASLNERLDEAKAEASTTQCFAGLGAWQKDPDTNLCAAVWQRALGRSTELDRNPCNWLFLDGGPLEHVELHLVSEQGVRGVARLRHVEHLWVYTRDPGGVIWEESFEVPAGWDGLVKLSPHLSSLPKGCYRLEVEGDAGGAWRMSGLHPWGLVGGQVIGSGRYHRRQLIGSHAFQLAPAQNVWGPDQVLSGGHRPQAQSNAWFAQGPLPQWVGISLPHPLPIREVILEFPDQLQLELHAENPFYVAPHIAKRYRLLARIDGIWEQLLAEENNRAAHKRHVFDERVADGIRVQIEETHGGGAGLCALKIG